MRETLKKLNRVEVYVFAGIFLLLVLKYFMITRITSDFAEFLGSYKFVAADSYDWIANGLRLFENDSITYRNPGLGLIIKALYHVNALYLLPLLSNMAFFVLIVYMYKLCKRFSNNTVALLLALLIAMNYTFNLGANYILADVYAVASITASLYYLVSKKYFWAFFLLGFSLLFQNIGYFLFFLWVAFFVTQNIKLIESSIRKRDIRYFVRTFGYLALAFLPVIVWNTYRLVKFGDPLYTKLDYFSLIRPDLDAVMFYSINLLTIFGFALIPMFVYFAFNIKKQVKNNSLILLWLGLFFNAVFWIILYDWTDRRFLLYFIPFIYPLLAYYLYNLRKNSTAKFVAVLLLMLPTILPITSFFTGDEIPLVHNVYIKTVSTPSPSSLEVKLQKRDSFENPIMNVSPILYNSITNSKKYHSKNSTWYTFYSKYISENFDEDENAICIDKKQGIRAYLVQSILVINNNTDIDEATINECVPAQ